MRKKVLNRRFVAIVLFSLLLFAISVLMLYNMESDNVFAHICFIIVGLVGIFDALIQPICLVFDKDSLTIKYFFGYYIRIKWIKVKEVEKAPATPGSLFMHDYEFTLWEKPEGKTAFFTENRIPASRKIKFLLKHYWKSDFQA